MEVQSWQKQPTGVKKDAINDTKSSANTNH